MNLTHEEIFNKAYKKYTPDYTINHLEKIKEEALQNAETLITFFEKFEEQFATSINYDSFLDLGSGLGGLSLYFARRGFKVSSLDVSSIALSVLSEILGSENLSTKLIKGNVTQNLNLQDKFSLIMDSHLLHCIVERDSRQNYFNFVKNHLVPGGIFLLETMVFHNKISLPVHYSIDQDLTLYKTFEEGELPIRKILTSLEIEEELKEAGFEIFYLYYHSELSFNVCPEYENYPHEFLPKTLRVAAKLSNS